MSGVSVSQSVQSPPSTPSGDGRRAAGGQRDGGQDGIPHHGDGEVARRIADEGGQSVAEQDDPRAGCRFQATIIGHKKVTPF